MSSFRITARVELHKDDKRKQTHSPDAKEYDNLHVEMHSRGFRRFYETVDHEMLKLPPGDYVIWETAADGSAARKSAMKKTKEAATEATSAERFSVFLSGGGNVSSYHLAVITEDPDV